MFGRSRQNLARWFTSSMGSILIVFAGVLYYLDVENELEAIDRLLYTKTRVMAASVNSERPNGQLQVNLDNVPLLGNTMPLNSELVYARWYDAQRRLVRFFGVPPSEQLTVTAGFITTKTASRLMQKQPGVVWLRQVTLAVYEDGELIGYLQVALPLTAIQAKLDELRLLLALAVTVALGIIGLAGWLLGGIAMQPIRQAYEQLQRFTSNASHELRAPLAAILSNAQVGLLSGDRAQQQLRLEKIVEGAKSMSSLVSNLLFLARHEGPLAPESLQQVNLNPLLQELAASYTTQASAQDLNFVSDLPQHPVNVQADADLLRQAVMNLLNNACKYTPSGGTIWLRLFTESRQAVIQVEDNGIGIPATALPHIFERFYRVDRERSRETGGFGLGLAIAQQIVEAHRGEITAASVVGQGSTFMIKLPLL